MLIIRYTVGVFISSFFCVSNSSEQRLFLIGSVTLQGRTKVDKNALFPIWGDNAKRCFPLFFASDSLFSYHEKKSDLCCYALYKVDFECILWLWDYFA